jgi:hypothetical protein
MSDNRGKCACGARFSVLAGTSVPAAWLIAALLCAGIASAQQAISVLQNFDGIAADGVAPPDTSGAAGGTQFVQWVNTEYAVYDKTGNLLKGPFLGNSLWKGFGGPCETMNSGSPMVEYDRAEGRWVLAQLALSSPAMYCFAVSTGDDATGTYNLYAFPFASGLVPNTPRLAVWTDAYYASFNAVSGTRKIPLVVAYDRTNMLAGTPARSPIFFQPAAQTDLLPSDFDGTVPPIPGQPEFYAQVSGADAIELFEFHVDFQTPAKSSFKKLAKVKTKDVVLCTRNPPQWKAGVIHQRKTKKLLDAIPGQLMYRLAWRSLNNVQHLLANQTAIVDVSSAFAEVAWYDMIVTPGSTPVLAQQGTVSDPKGAASYWIGSIAQDQDGEIALGFNASGDALFPSLEAIGPLAATASGTPPTQLFLVEGTGSQTNTSLWGTHADLTLDPTNDCVFWFTGEYVKTTGKKFDWSTRIASFQFNACH